MTLSLLRATLLAVVIGALAAGRADAQRDAAGTINFTFRLHTPDSAKTMLPIGDTIDIRGAMMTDGRRFAVELTLGPAMAMPIAEGLQFRLLFAPGADTIHAGILFPKEFVAPSGPSGYKMDLPISRADSVVGAFTDSALTSAAPLIFHSLGTKSVVATLTCEEWVEVMPTDTLHLCMIVEPAGIRMLRQRLFAGPALQRLFGSTQTAQARTAFGGREMLPIRVYDASGLHFEVTGIAAGAPDSTHFSLPANLVPFVNPLKPGGM